MTMNKPDKKEARALQVRTGWSYSECLRCIRELTAEQIEALIKSRGTRCEARCPANGQRCVKPEGHEGIHNHMCGAKMSKDGKLRCTLPLAHDGSHAMNQ